MSGQEKQTEGNMPKERTMREISVEGCQVLGKGGNGAVYRLDDETIVKVYFSNRHSPERINHRRETTNQVRKIKKRRKKDA